MLVYHQRRFSSISFCYTEIDIPCYTCLNITLCIKSPLLCIVIDPINRIVKYHNNMSSAKTINSAASHCKCYQLIGNVTTCTGSGTAWASLVPRPIGPGYEAMHGPGSLCLSSNQCTWVTQDSLQQCSVQEENRLVC